MKTDIYCPNCGTQSVFQDSFINGTWHNRYDCNNCKCNFYMPYLRKDEQMDEKYYLMYTEGCTPKFKEFLTEQDMNQFIGKFSVESLNNADNFIDAVFKGNLTLVNSNVEDFFDVVS